MYLMHGKCLNQRQVSQTKACCSSLAFACSHTIQGILVREQNQDWGMPVAYNLCRLLFVSIL